MQLVLFRRPHKHAARDIAMLLQLVLTKTIASVGDHHQETMLRRFFENRALLFSENTVDCLCRRKPRKSTHI
jgi:hypothetical protein